MDIVGKKKLYFVISLLVMIPGIISLLFYGLKLSIDFTGGSRLEYTIPDKTITREKLESVIEKQNVEVSSIQSSSNNSYIVRTKPIDQKTHDKIIAAVSKEYPQVKEASYETVGPTIGTETTWNALKAIGLASVLIVLYIAWSFRKVPKPASSWRFGVCAIIAVIHDVLVVIGIFSILGVLFNVEVDSLFVTAILTIIGFSVHDTIVVFDRIRENLRRMPNTLFGVVVNESITQTMNRSINTSLTTMLVLFTIMLFGGESVRWFVVALLIGILSGTYSSIFTAAPLLVVWQEFSQKRKLKNK